MADISSASGIDRFPYDPSLLDKVLRANDRQLGDLQRKSHRQFEVYMRSTPELKHKYDVK